MLVTDSYLAAVLSIDDQRACLEKLLDVERDPHEVALNRREALTGACNLVIDQPDDVRRETFAASRSFVLGEQDGSTLDEYTGEPHPLSSFKVNLGSASFRGHGLRLAAASANTPEEQEWVRDQAVTLLRSATSLMSKPLPLHSTGSQPRSPRASMPTFSPRTATPACANSARCYACSNPTAMATRPYVSRAPVTSGYGARLRKPPPILGQSLPHQQRRS